MHSKRYRGIATFELVIFLLFIGVGLINLGRGSYLIYNNHDPEYKQPGFLSFVKNCLDQVKSLPAEDLSKIAGKNSEVVVHSTLGKPIHLTLNQWNEISPNVVDEYMPDSRIQIYPGVHLLENSQGHPFYEIVIAYRWECNTQASHRQPNDWPRSIIKVRTRG